MSELAEIYRIYFDDVYRYLLALSHDAQLAEELTSETFCRAMRALPGFRGACDIRVWLCQIAKNCFYTEQKRMGRIELLDDSHLSTNMDGDEGPDFPLDIEVLPSFLSVYVPA